MNKAGKAVRRMWANHEVKNIGVQLSQWPGRLWIVAINYYGKIIDYYLTDYISDLEKTIKELKERMRVCQTQ